MRPWIYKCELTPTDWNLPENSDELAQQLNREFVNVINGGNGRDWATQKMAKSVAQLDVALEVKNSVLSVVDRLLRATFE